MLKFLLAAAMFTAHLLYGQPGFRLVHELDKLESSPAFVLDGSQLISASNYGYETLPPGPVVLIFDEALKLRHEVKVPSSVNKLFAVQPGVVVVAASDSLYELRTDTGSLIFLDYIVEKGLVPDDVLWGPSGTYLYSDAGEGIFQVPGRGIRVRYGNVSGAREMTLSPSGELWSIGLDRGQLFYSDLGPGSSQEIFRPGHFNLARLASYNLEGAQYVAVSSRRDKTAIDIFKGKNHVSHVSVDGGAPVGLTTLNQCFFATVEQARQVIAIRPVAPDQFERVATFDIPGEDRLARPTEILVDGDLGRIFLRSQNPCPSCRTTQSSVWVLEPEENLIDLCH